MIRHTIPLARALPILPVIGCASQRPSTTTASQVISFVREKDAHRVITIVNLSGDPQQITLQTGRYAGQYREIFTNKAYTLRGNHHLTFDRWGYLVLTRP